MDESQNTETHNETEPTDVVETPHFDLHRDNGDLFFNREISWLEFNFRVLEEAERDDNPLLERLKFIAICESNLEEFFMVRVAGLKQIVASSVSERQLDGKSPEETLQTTYGKVHDMVHMQYRLFNIVRDQLQDRGIFIIDDHTRLNEGEIQFVSNFFDRELFPVLSPLAVDPAHPFPHIAAGRLNMAVILERKDSKSRKSEMYAFVEIPAVFSRFIEIPNSGETSNGRPVRKFLAIEEILKLRAQDLFPGTTLKSVHGISITRNSDLSIDEVASENLLSTIEDELKNRMWGEAVRMNYRRGMPESIREFLRENLELEEDELFERQGLLNLHDLWVIYGICRVYEDLVDIPFIPKNVVPLDKPEMIFGRIRKEDIFLHHPYDSFQTVVDMLIYASQDPKVLAIKQTLYRTSGDSPIVKALIKAAENGKQVTALVELKARFDEENNIVWARSMEKHGVHVVYGLLGLKIHGKLLQIVRKEESGVRSYVHMATGNYNPSTARIYTDMGIITADEIINEDVTRLFHALTGSGGGPVQLKKLAAAPINLREKLNELIEREIHNAMEGKAARIRIKVNAVVDSEMILQLYRASMAGVPIEMNVRGICCLRPGIKGLSENIRVVSIVGRFLEHSRIYYFENNGNPEIYLSSADLMSRNLNRRVEVMFPVENETIKKQVVFILDNTFRDNHNARELHSNGVFTRLHPHSEEERFSSQRFFREQTDREYADRVHDRAEKRRQIFQPLMNPENESESGGDEK